MRRTSCVNRDTVTQSVIFTAQLHIISPVQIRARYTNTCIISRPHTLPTPKPLTASLSPKPSLHPISSPTVDLHPPQLESPTITPSDHSTNHHASPSPRRYSATNPPPTIATQHALDEPNFPCGTFPSRRHFESGKGAAYPPHLLCMSPTHTLRRHGAGEASIKSCRSVRSA